MIHAQTSRRSLLGGIVTAPLWSSSMALAQTSDLTALSIREAATLIRDRSISPIDLTRAYLERIEQLNGRVNAYITVTAGLALEQAERLEAELERGRWRGPLHGIPIALKDNMDTAGIPTTAASELFADRVPSVDAEVYRRLKEAGAILLGKLNLHEFAYGGTSAITHFDPVHNPWNLDYIPGGSSGGSAAAVAARMCAAALGTDTLASIRLPAAYCGVVGLKATHGLASIRGIIPISESLDHVGPLTRSVADTALVLQAIAGFDALDPVSVRASLPSYASALTTRTSGLRLGLPRDPYFRSLNPEIEDSTREAISVLTELSGGVRNIELPEVPNFSVLLAEAYAYHEQYVTDPVSQAGYDPRTLERILAAGEFSTSEYFNVRREFALVRNAIREAFAGVDLIITPTTPVMPTTIENVEVPATASGAESTVRNTAPFNLYGIPTISVPCGFGSDGLPIGLQISAAHFDEVSVLALAHAYEQATPWHLESPDLG